MVDITDHIVEISCTQCLLSSNKRDLQISHRSDLQDCSSRVYVSIHYVLTLLGA
jgi:hypothetical protein